MAAAADTLSNDFNTKAIGEFLEWSFKAVVYGALTLFVGGIIDFTFFHNHPAGQAIIGYFNDTMLGIYNTILQLFGFSDYAQVPDFLPDVSTGCTASEIGPDGITPIPCA